MLLIIKNLYWNEASIRPWGLIYLFHIWKVLLTNKVIKCKTIRLSNKSGNIFFHLRLELSAQLFEFWVIFAVSCSFRPSWGFSWYKWNLELFLPSLWCPKLTKFLEIWYSEQPPIYQNLLPHYHTTPNGSPHRDVK